MHLILPSHLILSAYWVTCFYVNALIGSLWRFPAKNQQNNVIKTFSQTFFWGYSTVFAQVNDFSMKWRLLEGINTY